MRCPAAPLVVAVLLGAVGPAAAGETACWFENGAVVAPASLGGLAGDYVIDLSAPRTLLHETKAQAAGYADTALTLSSLVAGERTAALPVAVVDLDARGAGFVTPIAGVIGIDLLGRYVVDLSFAPCRLRLSLPGRAPAFGGSALPVTVVAGVPAVRAATVETTEARAGLFAIDTASRAAVRRPRAGLPAAPRAEAADRLRALSFDGVLYEAPTAAIGEPPPAGLDGALGVDLWRGFTLRLDLAAGVLRLAPNEKGPGVAAGP